MTAEVARPVLPVGLVTRLEVLLAQHGAAVVDVVFNAHHCRGCLAPLPGGDGAALQVRVRLHLAEVLAAALVDAEVAAAVDAELARGAGS